MMAKKRESKRTKGGGALFPCPQKPPLVSFSLGEKNEKREQFSFDAVLGTDSTQEDVYQVSEGEGERKES